MLGELHVVSEEARAGSPLELRILRER